MSVELVGTILSWACIGAGCFFLLTGAIGLLRLPDFYSRTHAGGITDTLGAGLLLVGMMIHQGGDMITVRLILVLGFIALTSPTAGHALAKAAYRRGLKPWTKDGGKDDH